ncbi:putative Ig domain-containing protein [Streptomyces sp. NPDC000151]|uniref:putative Ig domain-containing protein n=1 Tax=Streptomyces sp. NPDC000151 TaxID=3154244 RepID=UPI00333103E9
MRGLGGPRSFGGRRGDGDGAPVELRFIDLLLIIIATLMFMAVLLALVSANASPDRSDTSRPPQIRVATAAAPDAVAGKPYALTLAAVGGRPPYHWARAAGELPEGLKLTEEGVVTGRARSASGPAGADEAAATATVRVQDAAGMRAQRTLRLAVVRAAPEAGSQRPSLRVVAKTLAVPEGKKGAEYATHHFQAAAGEGPYAWRAVGELPPGIRLSGAGALSGTPEKSGSFLFAVRVTDSTGARTEQGVRMTVGEPREERSDNDRWAPWYVYALAAIGALVVLQILKVIVFGSRGGIQPPVRGLRGLGR